jgi:hypothetical protein
MKEAARQINRETRAAFAAVRVRRDGTMCVKAWARSAHGFRAIMLVEGAIIEAALNLFA